MKKMLGLVLALGMVVSATAANRVGPVSQYGQLQAGKNAQNKGRIYGSCNPTPGNEVKVRGMSLYWSVHSAATRFYTETAITNMVNNMNIEIVRIPVGTSENCWSGDCAGGYINNASAQKELVDAVVAAAVKNDIYVIIDWHSHTANNQEDAAKGFFSYMAQTYGGLDNVIFEIFNEPIDQSWDQVKNYANAIIPEIRKYSDNLILVGNPSWDQHPEYAISAPVTDSKNNTAYTFHYYAGSHKINSEGQNAVDAINAGLSVFVSEWGTGTSDGAGNPNDYTSQNGSWQDWLNAYDLSAANWSASAIDEGTAAFTTSSTPGNISYTASGNMVKEFLESNPSSYTACKDAPVSSSTSTASSSSVSGEGSPLIDDFEDGNGIPNTNLDDTWYAFTDSGDKGTSSFTNEKEEEGYTVVIPEAAAGGSAYGAGLTGIVWNQGENKYEPYVTLGLNVKDGLVGCTIITYKYKGAAHNLKAVTSGDEEGALSEYNYHKSKKSASTSWTSATVEIGDLAQETGWGSTFALKAANIVKLQWEVKGALNDREVSPSPDYLYIDDVACEGMNIVPVVVPDEESSASETTSSETVEVSSSSFENPACEDGETASAGTLTMLCVEGEWTVVAASSSSATPAAGSAMIDDVEDGDGQAFTGGYWFAYTDVNDKGSSIITNSPDDDGGYVVVLPGTNGTENMVGLTGISLVQGSNKNEPYVSLGLNITEEDAANDFTSCTEISYDYMGAAHNFKAIMKGDAKGELTGYNRHDSTQSSSTTWTTATLSWSDLKQAAGWGTTVSLDKSLLTAFHWEVKGDKSGTQPSPNYLYIDNLQCKGMNIVPVTSSSSEEVVESSSSEEITTSECEDGQEIHVGSAALKCVEGKWTDISVGSSSSAGGSSSSEGGSSASTGAPGVIDDMEDGDNQAFSGGYWFVYNDANDKGQSSFGNALDGKDYVVVFDGTNGSDYMVGMKDVSLVQGGNENEPYVAMGVNITDEKKANNLASCTEISYDYIGAAHNFKAIMAGDETGGLTGYNRHSKAVSASTTWTKATIDWSALSQATGWGKTLTLDKTKITAFHWEIKGDKNGTQPSPNYLYVDNFTCTGLDVAALASSSSSSQPTSSSSYNPYLPTSSSSYDPWAIGAVQARGGLKVSMFGSTLNVTVERAGLVKVNVFDMMGHAIESHVENLSAGTYGHSLANLSKGAYIVRVQQGSEQKVIRTQVR